MKSTSHLNLLVAARIKCHPKVNIAELETVTQIKDKKRESDIYAREHEFALAIERGIIRSVVGSP